jgi:hypothetical protein
MKPFFQKKVHCFIKNMQRMRMNPTEFSQIAYDEAGVVKIRND